MTQTTETTTDTATATTKSIETPQAEAAHDTLKFDAKQSGLIAALNVVGRAVPGKTSYLPVLGNVLLSAHDGKLSLRTTNLDLTIELSIDATVWTEGETTVPQRLLADYVAQLDESHNVSFDLPLPKKSAAQPKMALSSGGDKANIVTIAAADFPTVPEVTGPTFSVPCEAFRDVVMRTAFAAAKGDERPVLNGVLLRCESGKLTLAAADGFRLAASTLNVDGVPNECFAIIPVKTLDVLTKLLPLTNDKNVEITLSDAGNYARFVTDELDVCTRLISGQFPAYERIIPSESKTSLTLSTPELSRAVRAATVFARDSSNIVHMSVKSGGPLTLMAMSAMQGDIAAEVEAQVEGEDFDIAFNATYVREVLDVIGTDKTTVSILGASSPGVFRPVGDTTTQRLHVIMPMYVAR